MSVSVEACPCVSECMIMFADPNVVAPFMNHCALATHLCSKYATCLPQSQGTYTCECNDGYVGETGVMCRRDDRALTTVAPPRINEERLWLSHEGMFFWWHWVVFYWILANLNIVHDIFPHKKRQLHQFLCCATITHDSLVDKWLVFRSTFLNRLLSVFALNIR